MKISKIKPSREFEVGISRIKLKHTADIELDDNEMVTFRNKNNLEYDVTKKNWGFYATPSLGGRLKNKGYNALIMRNKKTRQCYIVIVENGFEDEFQTYCREENQEILTWLNDFEKLANMSCL